MSVYPGHRGKVTIGAVTVGSMNSWNLPGIENEMLEKPLFGEEWKQFEYGQGDGGEIQFSGFYDADDAAGQTILNGYAESKANCSNLRLYYGKLSSEFYRAIPGAVCLVKNVKKGAVDTKTGLVPIQFTFQISNGYFSRVAGCYAATDISFTHTAGAANDTINKPGGTTFLATFLAGQTLVVEGSTSNNLVLTIKAGGVAANVLTVSEDTITSEAAGGAVSLISFPILS